MNLYVITQNGKVNKIFTSKLAAELYVKLHSVSFEYEEGIDYFIEEHEADVISVEFMEKRYLEFKEASMFGYGFFFDQRGNLLNIPRYQRLIWRDIFNPVKEKEEEMLVIVDCEDETEEKYQESLEIARDIRERYIKEKFGLV